MSEELKIVYCCLGILIGFPLVFIGSIMIIAAIVGSYKLCFEIIFEYGNDFLKFLRRKKICQKKMVTK